MRQQVHKSKCTLRYEIGVSAIIRSRFEFDFENLRKDLVRFSHLLDFKTSALSSALSIVLDLK